MEVSCKAAAGKSICAFPDVCMTPPQTPATPPGVPIPYPNTGMASDTSDGSTSVKVSNQEVMLKNKSSFSKSMGDEAGAAPMKGVLTHKNMGKVFFTAWSMDVKVEGENVVRMLDLTTHNHGSMPGNSPPFPYIDEACPPAIDVEHEIKCAIKKCDGASYDISKTAEGNAMPANSRCGALGSKKHKCVKDELEKKGVPCKCEQTFDMTKSPPSPSPTSPGKGLGRRPDIVVPHAPPSASYDVYDAKFPCSSAVKSSTGPSTGVMQSAPTSGSNYVKPTSKEYKDYTKIANGGKSKPVTPEDCKHEECNE
jgi:hypothetical protein